MIILFATVRTVRGGLCDTIQRLIKIMQPVTTTTKPSVIAINNISAS